MRELLVIASLVTLGCSASDRPPDLGGGGGGGGGGSGSGDSDGGADASSAVVDGSLCQLADVRFPTACSAADLTGVDVVLRGVAGEVTTPASGEFSFPSPGGSAVVLEVGVSSLGVQPSLIEAALDEDGNATIVAPLVTTLVWENLKASVGTSEPAGTGTVAIYVRAASTPVAGASVISMTASFAPFYDGTTALDWNSDGLTGTAGAALLFAVPADIGTTDFTVIGPGGSPTLDVIDVPVLEGTTTFVTVSL